MQEELFPIKFGHSGAVFFFGPIELIVEHF